VKFGSLMWIVVSGALYLALSRRTVPAPTAVPGE
jgi:hypothetical protein